MLLSQVFNNYKFGTTLSSTRNKFDRNIRLVTKVVLTTLIQTCCSKIVTKLTTQGCSSSVNKYIMTVPVLLKYNFVETPRKFIIAKLSIRKLGFSSVPIIMLIIMHYY